MLERSPRTSPTALPDRTHRTPACAALAYAVLLAACTGRAPAPEEQRDLALLAAPGSSPSAVVRVVVGSGSARSDAASVEAWAERLRTARPDLVVALAQPADSRTADGALIAAAGATSLGHLLWSPDAEARSEETWLASRWPVARSDEDTLVLGTGDEAVALTFAPHVRWGCAAGDGGARVESDGGVAIEVCAPWTIARSAGDSALGGFAVPALRIELRRAVTEP